MLISLFCKESCSTCFAFPSREFILKTSRRPCHIQDQALAILLDEDEDDFLFGDAPPASSSCEEDDSEVDNDPPAHRISKGLDGNLSDDEPQHHYLNCQVKANVISLHFVREGGTGLSNEPQEPQQGQSTQVTKGIRCGCSFECLKKFASDAVEVNRLNM